VFRKPPDNPTGIKGLASLLLYLLEVQVANEDLDADIPKKSGGVSKIIFTM